MEEVKFVATLMHTLSRKCDVASVTSALDHGAQRGLWDACICLHDGTELFVDYDGGHWHQKDRMQSDIAKVERLLQQRPNAIPMRARVKAPLLQLPAKCIQILSDTANLRKLMQLVHMELVKKLPDTHQIKTLQPMPSLKMPLSVADDVIMVLDKRFRAERESLLQMFDGNKHLAKKLEKILAG
jgi:hypothetical protein